mgnify:CR=1 FL=1
MGKEFQQWGIALGSYAKAFPYLLKPGYRRYLLLPVLVNLLFLIAVVWAALVYAEPLLTAVLNYFNIDLSSWGKAWSSVAVIVLQILSFLLFLSVYKYVVLVVLAPLLAFLSEKVEKDLLGQDFPFSWSQFVQDIGRALVINGFNLIRELGLTLLLSILGFIPLVGLAAPFLILLVQSYFYGYGLLDYNAERWRFTIGQTEKYMWQHKGQTIAIGLVFHFIFLIPLVGWILAPIWSVIAATLSAVSLKTKMRDLRSPRHWVNDLAVARSGILNL